MTSPTLISPLTAASPNDFLFIPASDKAWTETGGNASDERVLKYFAMQSRAKESSETASVHFEKGDQVKV